MPTRSICFILAILLSNAVMAQDFQIIKFKPEPFRVGQDEKNIGDIITASDRENIQWTDGQYVILKDLQTRREYTLTAEIANKKRFRSLKEYIRFYNGLFSKGDNDVEFPLADTLRLTIPAIATKPASVKANGKDIPFEYDDDKSLVLHSNALIFPESVSVPVSVFLPGLESPVYSFNIIQIPDLD